MRLAVMFDLRTMIERFFQQVAAGSIEIYNEFSLQHELGIFLRAADAAGQYKVQFERPVGFFGLTRSAFVKNEIDLAVFRTDRSERAAIEVKFPRNGQYSEQMFKFCQYVAFVEQLVSAGFDAGLFLAAADDPLFYSGPQRTGIYGPFRGGAPLQGTIVKPTGKHDETIELRGSYAIQWRHAGLLRYAYIVADPGRALHAL